MRGHLCGHAEVRLELIIAQPRADAKQAVFAELKRQLDTVALHGSAWLEQAASSLSVDRTQLEAVLLEQLIVRKLEGFTPRLVRRYLYHLLEHDARLSLHGRAQQLGCEGAAVHRWRRAIRGRALLVLQGRHDTRLAHLPETALLKATLLSRCERK